MFIEIYKPWIKKHGTVEETIRKGWYIEWTPERIKGAFNFGNGTKKDFKRYRTENKKLCLFLEV